jgi:DNA end-binding protein Ku
MRAIWKGAVSFGLVNVPVRLFAATEEHDIRFHQVHREDGGRIRYKRTCSICGEEVSYDDIAKGYETSDGQLVILTDEDLEQLPVASGHEIDVVEFVPSDQVDPILFARSYYLEPDARTVKPYALLREALVETDRMAIVKVALRQRETLAVLRVRDKAILLQTMLWPDEIRNPNFASLDTDVELRPQELSMAASLIESMAAEFEPSQFTDDYRQAMIDLIDAKIERGDSATLAEEAKPAASGTGEVIDLLTALQRSVDRARGTTAAAQEQSATTTDGTDTGTDQVADAADTSAGSAKSAKAAGSTKAAGSAKSAASSGSAPSKKAAAKKASARKEAPKKAAAKKAPAKRAARSA